MTKLAKKRRTPLQRTLRRVNNTLRNGAEVIRFGGLHTTEEAAPFDVVYSARMFRLRRYFPDAPAHSANKKLGQPAVLLVPPLMLDTGVYDMSESVSSVRQLNQYGVAAWVVDFGAPEREEGGMERSLTDHVLAVSQSIDLVAEKTGQPVHVAGYSQGGLFCYMAAAYRKSDNIASVITFGSPVDMSHQVPNWLPTELVQTVSEKFASNILANTGVPGWLISAGFQSLDPIAFMRHRVKFLMQLHNRDALLPREKQRQFIEGGGFVGYAGPAIAELMAIAGASNRLMSGGFDFLGQTVTLADITCPILVLMSPVDAIATPPAVRGIRKASPLADLYEVGMSGGHLGLVCSTAANEKAWPAINDWLRWHQNGAAPKKRPERIKPWSNEPSEADEADSSLSESVSLALEVAAGVGQNTVRTITNTVELGSQLLGEAREQLPQLMRLDVIRPSSKISMARLLDEQGDEAPQNIAFLFDGRSHSYANVNERINNIVKGLISVGVRRGEHIGVLMNTRPSAITLIAAINRLGAVGVLLRPDGDPARELQLGGARRLITDPESAASAASLKTSQLLVLGGGGQERDLSADLGTNVIDMERIDPAKVELPKWYQSNPGRARELAFILFTGGGDNTRANRISNGRWALSAFGTATAASVSQTDTVYGTTMHYHPSGLLTTFGCAIAGGARLALTDKFRPETFWEEARRYGATVVSYTWTSLREVVDSPPHPLESSNSIRLLIGSGMPVSLWNRALERFAPAKVVEFYASTEGEAVLANVDSSHVGAQGSRLPGSARIKLAAYDLEKQRLVSGPDGYAQEAEEGETGMLLVQAGEQTGRSALRGLFSPDDAWLQTGDLFEQRFNQYWWMGSASQLIETKNGRSGTRAVENAIGQIGGVDLALGYGCGSQTTPGGQQLVVAVATLPEKTLSHTELNNALADLPVAQRPERVHVVANIPSTSWYRLQPKDSWRKKLPVTRDASLPVFELKDGRYRKMALRKTPQKSS